MADNRAKQHTPIAATRLKFGDVIRMCVKDRTGYSVSAALAWFLPNRLMRFAFLDQAVASGGNFVAAILLARALGIYEFGRFALAWMLVEFVGSLQFAAIIQPMLNIGAKQGEADRNRYYHAVIVQQAAACIVFGFTVGLGVALLGWLTSNPTLIEVALPLCIAIITYQIYEFCRRYLFARDRPAEGLCTDLLRFGVQLGAIVALPIAWPDATAEAGIWIVTIACAVAITVGGRFLGSVKWDAIALRGVVSRHWQFSKWLLPSSLMFWTTSEVYMVVSGLVLGAAATGALKAATTITGVLNILLLALNNFAPVQASHALHVGGPAALRHYIGRLAALSASLIAAVVIALNIAPEYLVHLLYGEEFEGLGQIVRLLCAPAAVYGIGVVLAIWAAALEQTHIIFWSYAVATVVSVAAVFPSAHYGGLPGVVLCLFLVESIRIICLLVPLMRSRR